MASQAGEQVMHDIGIIAIGPIVTELESDTQARKISIQILSAVLAMELAAKIVKHLREEQTLSAEEQSSPPQEN
jgi:hypothetical protein